MAESQIRAAAAPRAQEGVDIRHGDFKVSGTLADSAPEGESKFRDVVLQDTRPEEWPAIRTRIRQRVAACMGTPPQVKVEPEMQVVKEYENYGLKHVKIRFRVLPDEYGLAVMVMPEGVSAQRPARKASTASSRGRPRISAATRLTWPSEDSSRSPRTPTASGNS